MTATSSLPGTPPDREADRPATGPRRTDGFVPIADYAAIGDGRTVALVAADGAVDWWPLPTLDSPPVFAGVLDPDHGGHVVLRPVEEFTSRRRYVADSNVLETTFETPSGRVRVTDALDVGLAGRLPWTELVRRIDGDEGTVAMRWAVVPGDRFGTAGPWIAEHDGALAVHVGDQHLLLQCHDIGAPQVGPHQVTGEFTVTAGECGVLALLGVDDEPMVTASREDLITRLDRTVSAWSRWNEELSWSGPYEGVVRRSALALKLLVYAPTGAITAAPTTSLPERIGGPKNWDYRYAWVRDSSFTVDALISLGLHEEVHAAVSWLLGAVRSTAPDLHVFYKLDGRVPEAEAELPAPGYRGSRPVRNGNGASNQSQLGTFGDLFDTVHRYVQHGHLLDPGTGRLLADLADRCCDVWRQADAGIWELGDIEHYTISKIGCWVALDRAVRLHARGAVPVGHVGRWETERDAIRAWVDEHCWSERKRSYTFHADTEDLDAATLLAGRTGFCRGERLAGTVDAIRRELADGPAVYRYSGMREEEGAFVACSFWLVEALVVLDRLDEAEQLMAGALALGNDVGLFSEQVDPATGELLGNFPQGLSHLALVNAATALRDAREG